MSTDRKFDVYREWTQACDGVGLEGPIGVQGFGNFEYRSADGTQAAFWNGSTQSGVVHVDIPDPLVNVPEVTTDGQ